MLVEVSPKLPMRNKDKTRAFYVDQLGFTLFGKGDYPGYLMLQKDRVQLHFFEFPDLDPESNYGQVYIRTDQIDRWYQELLARKVPIHPHGQLQVKPWGQKEFSLLDPDRNLLTFGQDS